MWRQRILFLTLAGMLLGWSVRETAVPADNTVEMPAEQRYAAITFDDGPKEGTTDRLLDGLKERGASATFFLIGEQAALNQGLVRRIKEEGHQVGNHTWSHVRLENAPPDVVQTEIGNTETLLATILGEGNYWLRPPYGLISGAEQSIGIAVPMVKWSVDPRDWESRNADKIVAAVLKEVQPNSIILLHDIYPASVDAALCIVDALQAEGYWFVTVEELLRLNGVIPQAGVLYRTGKG